MTKTLATVAATLLFTETDGLEYLAGGNTFRLGFRYDALLNVGDTVAIADAEGNVLGEETVADIFTGNLREMIRVHAGNSYDFRKPNSEARKRDLRSAMNQWYAGQVVDDMAPTTVIYFEPRDEVETTLSTFIEDDEPGGDVVVDHSSGVAALGAIMASVNSDVTETPEVAAGTVASEEIPTPTTPTPAPVDGAATADVVT